MQKETISTIELARAEARLPHWMTAGAFVGALVMLLAGYSRAAAGFAVGSALAILNYFWLHQVVETLMTAGQARVPKRVVAKFAARYPLIFAGVYLFYRTGWLPVVAILAGLFVPVGGILIEAVFQIYEGLRKV